MSQQGRPRSHQTRALVRGNEDIDRGRPVRTQGEGGICRPRREVWRASPADPWISDSSLRGREKCILPERSGPCSYMGQPGLHGTGPRRTERRAQRSCEVPSHPAEQLEEEEAASLGRCWPLWDV